jgi:hypothetical protein
MSEDGHIASKFRGVYRSKTEYRGEVKYYWSAQGSLNGKRLLFKSFPYTDKGEKQAAKAYLTFLKDNELPLKPKKRQYNEDLAGKKFGRITIIEKTDKRDGQNKALWKCLCSTCGKISFKTQKQIYRPRMGQLFCRCSTLEPKGSKMKFYGIWSGMMTRCYNTKSRDYKNWGARGIAVCDKWRNNYFEFHKWAESRWRAGLSLDRRNNDKNYSPSNCRFTTPSKQINNRRATVWITIDGKKKSLKEWAAKYDICNILVYKRLKAGWDILKALTIPTQRPNARKYQHTL